MCTRKGQAASVRQHSCQRLRSASAPTPSRKVSPKAKTQTSEAFAFLTRAGSCKGQHAGATPLRADIALIPSSGCSRRTWTCSSTCRRRSRTSRSRTDGGSRNCSRSQTKCLCRWKYRRRFRTNRRNSDTCRYTCSSGSWSTCRRQSPTTAYSRGCSSAAAQNRGKQCRYSCCRKNTYEKPPEKISGSGCSRSILWRRCADGVRLCRFLPRPAVPAGPARAAGGCLASSAAS